MIDLNAPIGVFDSGLGGLEIASQIANAFPHESLVYVGDTARVPYGTRSPECVKEYTLEAAEFLVKQGIKALVVACNTASCYALTALRETYNLPIFGMIQPGVEASSHSQSGVLVLATSGTIRSQAYQRALLHQNPDRVVLSLACPLFVPLVENGWMDRPLTLDIIKEHLSSLHEVPFKKEDVHKIDTCLLGCTHYPLLSTMITQSLHDLLNQPIHVVHGGGALIKKLASELSLKSSSTPPPTYQFYTTDDPYHVFDTAHRFWKSQTQMSLPSLTQITF